MPVTVNVWEELIPSRRAQAEPIVLADGCITVRELIQRRIEQEVERYNQSQPEVFDGLVQPEESERILNGFRMKRRRALDRGDQCARSLRSFQQNGFLLFVDGRQVSDLDERLELRSGSEVQFIKLAPLIGG